MENFSYVYKNEVYINEDDYDQAFCIALEFARQNKCKLEVNEIADGDPEDSFELSFDKKTRRIKEPITFKTLKS